MFIYIINKFTPSSQIDIESRSRVQRKVHLKCTRSTPGAHTYPNTAGGCFECWTGVIASAIYKEWITPHLHLAEANCASGSVFMGRRVHPSTAYTYQPHSPIGLDLELLNQPLKSTPKVPVERSPERLTSRVSLGAGSAALGPAL